VPIYYEARLAKIDLKPEERPKIDPNFEEGASRTGIRRRGGSHEGKPAPEVGAIGSGPTLEDIARELVAHVRKSVTIDRTLRESAQAQIRVIVRRILRKYGYPPDKQEKATQTVLEQAKLLCAEWTS
jgi:hypothetical protein